MKKKLTLFFLIAFTNLSYGQIDPKAQESLVFENKLNIGIKTLVFSTTGVPFNTLRKFKKELSGWNGKVISSQIDTIQQKFTIVHNLHLHYTEMEEFLNKYHIKKSSIISYN